MMAPGDHPTARITTWRRKRAGDEDAELDMSALQQFAATLSKRSPQILSGAGQGAATGATFAGPWGALIGGGLGAAQSLLAPPKTSASPTPRPRPAPAVASPLAPPITAAPSSPAAPALAPSTAVQQLAQLLGSVAIQQAIASAVGGATTTGIEVGGTNQSKSQVPIGALLALLGAIANTAAEEAESDADDDGYLKDGEGAYRCDPAVPQERNQLLLELVLDSSEMEASPEAWMASALG